MNKNSLKSSLKNYYSEKELSTYQLERLVEKKKSIFSSYALGVSLASLILVFILLRGAQDFNDKVMNEIVYNHNKALESEIITDELSAIQNKLAKLDFQLVHSQKFPKNRWKVIGARYCSIQGEIAAQIKMKDLKTGNLYTLYQSKNNEELSTSRKVDSIDGVEVQVWSEKGLLFGIAGPNAISL